jgi:hypothetical protein
MNSNKTLEYVLDSLYAACLSSSSNEQRAVANETLARCADLPYAPPDGSDMLYRIAGKASGHQQAFDPPEAAPRPCPAPLGPPVHREHPARSSSALARPHLRLVS